MTTDWKINNNNHQAIPHIFLVMSWGRSWCTDWGIARSTRLVLRQLKEIKSEKKIISTTKNILFLSFPLFFFVNCWIVLPFQDNKTKHLLIYLIMTNRHMLLVMIPLNWRKTLNSTSSCHVSGSPVSTGYELCSGWRKHVRSFTQNWA